MPASSFPPDEAGITIANLVAEAATLRAGLADLDGRIAMLQKQFCLGSQVMPSDAPSLLAGSLPTATEPRPIAPALPATTLTPPPLPPMAQQPPPVPPPLPRSNAQTAPDMWSGPIVPVPVPEPKASSLEMKIGGTWLVRVGIVALLASLALLTSYFYQHVVPHLGPPGKVALLLAGSGALAGLGAWLERRAQATNPGLLNYARVLLGGGLAAVYYVLYAAHANPALRVIASPWLAGAVQLGWAAFMVWLADRRRSQTLATGAILLAYFTSASNGVGTFTLFSNLALTVAAVFLLRRHRWMAFSFASLLATYGSYAFWHFAGEMHGVSSFAHPESGVSDGHSFALEFLFLSFYWLLFTVAVFQSDEEKTPVAADNRALIPTPAPAYSKATFATLNNGAFFLLTNFLVDAAHPTWLWRHAAGFGLILVALSAFPRLAPKLFAVRETPEDPSHRESAILMLAASTASSYRLLGLVLFTLGLVVRFSGWNLALALAAESVVLQLAALGQARDPGRRLLPTCAIGVGFLSILAVWLHLRVVMDLLRAANPAFDLSAVAVGVGVAAAMLFNATWSRRALDRHAAGDHFPTAAISARSDWVPALPAAFSFFATLVLLTLLNAPQVTGLTLAARPLALALAAVGLTAIAYPTRLASLAATAPILLLGAMWRWIEFRSSTMQTVSVNSIALTLLILTLLHWWQYQRHFVWHASLRAWLPHWTQLWLAGSVIAILYLWLDPHFTPPARMALWSLLAVAILAYGWLTQAWSLAAMSQFFLLAAAILFVRGLLDLLQPPADLWRSLAPVGAALAATLLTTFRPPFGESFPPGVATPFIRTHGWLSSLGSTYESLTLLLAAAWVFKYVDSSTQFAVFALLGALLFAAGAWRKNIRWLFFSVLPTSAGLLLYWIREFGQLHSVFWLDILAIGLLFLQQRLGRRCDALPPRAATPAWAHTALMTVVVLTLWRWLTDLLNLRAGGSFFLAVGWSLFAAVVFAAGLAYRERIYRWLGLGVLLVTLGRVVVIDLWQAEALHRILGLLALGAVLLGFGFVYNRYGTKLREWL